MNRIIKNFTTFLLLTLIFLLPQIALANGVPGSCKFKPDGSPAGWAQFECGCSFHSHSDCPVLYPCQRGPSSGTIIGDATHKCAVKDLPTSVWGKICSCEKIPACGDGVVDKTIIPGYISEECDDRNTDAAGNNPDCASNEMCGACACSPKPEAPPSIPVDPGTTPMPPTGTTPPPAVDPGTTFMPPTEPTLLENVPTGYIPRM